MKVPFNKPYVPIESKKYAMEVLESSHQHGDGRFTERASSMIANLSGGGHVLLTPSCTHALEMASWLISLGPGDKVILPSYNFTSAAVAITRFGAQPVFVDVRPDTKCIDTEQIESAIDKDTRAISWVNYAGRVPNLEHLKELSEKYDLILIEDNAHGFGAKYGDRFLGSFGDFSTLSFHATKNIQCGEGGALIINDKSYVERAEVIREKGTDRRRFLRGDVQKYQWVDHGSSYLLAEVCAAVLFGQLENFDDILKNRRNIWKRYSTKLKAVSELESSLLLPSDNVHETNAHMFDVLLKRDDQRSELISHLYSVGIQANAHYQSLHNSKFGQTYATDSQQCQTSKSLSEKLLRLPLWCGMTEDQVDSVVIQISNWISTKN